MKGSSIHAGRRGEKLEGGCGGRGAAAPRRARARGRRARGMAAAGGGGAAAAGAAAGGGGGRLAPGIARRVRRALELRADAPGFLEALEALGAAWGEEGAGGGGGGGGARGGAAGERGGERGRELREVAERERLGVHEAFLEESSRVQDALGALDAEIAAVAACCDGVAGALAAARAQNGGLLAEAGRLQGEIQTAEQRRGLVGRFLEEYQLSPRELGELREGEVGAAFFRALGRVRGIHANCRQLLRTHHHRAGLELMEGMARHQEEAYERLCRWVQVECRGLGPDSGAGDPVVETLQAACAALRERPVLYRYCAEEVAAARHNVLFKRFLAALTAPGGGPGGSGEAIDKHAQDPRRYVGDMLTWLHGAAASEGELLKSLFGTGGGEEPGQGAGAGAGAGGGEQTDTRALLDKIFEGTARPFQVRVEQVLTGPGIGAVLAFQLMDALWFYLGVLRSSMGERATLVISMEAGHKMAKGVLHEQVEALSRKLVRAAAAPPASLLPSQGVVEWTERTAALLAAMDESPCGADSPENRSIVPLLLQPLKEHCAQCAAAARSDAESGGAGVSDGAEQMYTANCLLGLKEALQPFRAAAEELMVVEADADGSLEQLAAGAVARLVATCGLEERLARIRVYRSEGGGGGVMANDDALRYEALSGALRAMFGYFQSAGSEALPGFKQLRGEKERGTALRRTKAGVVQAYGEVFDALCDPQNGYGAAVAADLHKYSSDSFKRLL